MKKILCLPVYFSINSIAQKRIISALVLFFAPLLTENLRADTFEFPGFPGQFFDATHRSSHPNFDKFYLDKKIVLENDAIYFESNANQEVLVWSSMPGGPRDGMTIDTIWYQSPSYLKATTSSRGERLAIIGMLIKSMKSPGYLTRIWVGSGEYREIDTIPFFGAYPVQCVLSNGVALTDQGHLKGCALSKYRTVPMNIYKPTQNLIYAGRAIPGELIVHGYLSYYETGELRTLPIEKPIILKASPLSGQTGMITVSKQTVLLDKNGDFIQDCAGSCPME